VDRSPAVEYIHLVAVETKSGPVAHPRSAVPNSRRWPEAD